jgi:uncharacterized protein YegL
MLGGTLSLMPLLVPKTLPYASGTIIKNIFFDDMESGPGGWSVEEVLKGSTSTWELGVPTGVTPHSGVSCWATEISGDYQSPTEVILITPSIDLTSKIIINTNLSFWHYYDFYNAAGAYDGGWIEVNYSGVVKQIFPDGGYPGWVNSGGSFKLGYSRTNGVWDKANFNLSAYIGKTITIRFHFVGNLSIGGFLGWYLDDVSLDIEHYEPLLIGPDQTKIGLGGETLSYTLTINNYDTAADFIDIHYTDTKNWQIRILNATTYLPLRDNGGVVGLPDVYLYPGTSINIIVNVTIPMGTEWDVPDITTIYVVSFVEPLNQDTAELITKTPKPDVGVSKIKVPEIRNLGDTINITVTVKNYGDWTVSFNVEGLISAMMIIPPSTIEPQLQWVSNLAPDGSVDIKWSFIPTIACEYSFTATTLLDIDIFIYNNKSTKSIYIQHMLWTDDMETGGDAANGLWTHFIDGSSTSITDWELGIPTWSQGPPASSVPSKTNCWGTDLNYAYSEDTDCYLFTPASSAFDFRGSASITLAFSHWWKLQSTTNHGEDVGMLVYTFDPDPISTIYLPGIEYKTNSNGWENEEIDMTSFVKDEAYVRFGWRLFEDIRANKFEPGVWPGWYLDDVAVWASPAMPELIITEIVDSGGTEYIEVYNKGPITAYLSDYGITLDNGVSCVSLGTWNKGSVPSGGYAYYSISPGLNELDDQGESIYLVNRTMAEGLITSKASYGQKGTVPDPLSGESVARYREGGEYKDEWARDTSPTIGSQNDGTGEVDFKYVVLNEVLYNPGIREAFVELRYVGYPGNDPDVDVSGWILVVGNSVFTIPATPYDPTLNLLNPFYVINVSMFQGLFDTVDVNGDNIYLYDSNGWFVDEVGWSLPHTQDTSMSRVPDGYGVKLGFKMHGLMGYDDPSSIAAGWQFLRIPSMSIVGIEQDQTSVGDAGWTIVYDLSIINHQDVADYIDIFFTTPKKGWIVELYEANNVTLLTDNEGDGIIDTDLLNPNEIIMIKVKVTIPSTDIGDFDEIIVNARSSKNLNGYDTAVIRTETYPHIEVNKTSSINEIWLNGTGMFPQSTTITLEIRGSGLAQSKSFSQDVILCIDSSGSMISSDPSDLRKDAAKSYVDDMLIPDRGAVVDFDSVVNLLNPLSTDYVQIKRDIDTIDSSGGTAIGAALKLANDELIKNGDPNHIQVIILLTDGVTIDEQLCYKEAARAAANGIKIYTIGLGSFVDEELLQDIADITGAKYYPASTPEALEGIYYEIRTEIMDIAGKDMTVGDDVYFVRDVLQPWIDFIPGTFNVLPSNITVDNSGYTILEWEVNKVLVGETFTFTFDVVSNKAGLVQTNYVPDSRARYIKWSGEEVIELFPGVLVNVKLGPPLPPQLFAKVVGNDVQLYWDILDPARVVDHYLIYRSPSQTNFDFSEVWVNTSQHDNNGIIPSRATWNITDGALETYPLEEYYIIRAVNQLGKKSVTSNTVGKWTKKFYEGVNTFSLPLEPFKIKSTEWYTNDIPSCEHIKWMNTTTQTWTQHNFGDGLGINDSDVVIGDAYEVSVSVECVYTFCGRPGAHIRYVEDELPAPSNFKLNVVNEFGDVELNWDHVPGADHYIVYKSGTREGLNNLNLLSVWETTYGDPFDTHYKDYNAAFFGGTQYYYMVVAVSDPSLHSGFNSTYSIGVWTGRYDIGYDTFGLPLKLDSVRTADWFCDAIPNLLGMNYFNVTNQRWMWHKTIMPQGAYDPDVIMAEGYQISTIAETKYSFIGI